MVFLEKNNNKQSMARWLVLSWKEGKWEIIGMWTSGP